MKPLKIPTNTLMENSTAEKLARLNCGFYERNARSFSQTRQKPWPGWARVLDITGQPSNVLDLASGNLRFQKYVNERYSDATIRHYCVDSCESLVDGDIPVSFQNLDIARCLYERISLEEAIQAPPCDLCTSFGFMHHVYGQEARIELAKSLLEKTLPGGHCAISFWRFADVDELREKAVASTEEALQSLDVDLLENDYLVGWNGIPGEYRYCHSFTDSEISEIARAMKGNASPTYRFESDGRTNAMNTYLVLARK